MQLKFQRHELFFEVGVSVRGLGCDTMQGGHVRRIPVLSARCDKYVLKSQVVKQMLTACQQARKLALAGVKPVVFGHEAVGMSPTALRKIRSATVGALGIKKPGGCATTAVAIRGYLPYDPLATLRRDVVVAFLFAVASSKLQLTLQYKWDNMVSFFCPQRWQKVTGPADASIGTLVDVDWFPEALHTDGWSLEEMLGILISVTPCFAQHFKHAFMPAVHKHIWQKHGTRHHYAGGAPTGIDVTVGRQFLYRL